MADGQKMPIALSGAWTAPDTFTLDVAFTHTPNRARYTHTFAGEQVTLTAVPNLGPPAGEPMVGRRQPAAAATGGP